MTLDHWLSAPLAHALGRALAHFLWQGALLAAALRMALFLGAERSARWRHLAATVCLLALPLAFGVTLALSLGTGHSTAVLPPLVAPRTAFAPVIAQGSPAAPVDRLAWLAPLWMCGVILFYAFRLAGWVRVDRLRRRGVCAAPPEWQQRLCELAVAVRVSQPVELLESCLASVPQVIGYWRPVILMPLGALAGLSAEQVEAILIHELAHIRRADYLLSMAQSLVEGLFFFHPAVWWMSAVVRAEREYACDDVVVALRPNARVYAAALTTLEQSRWPAILTVAAANGGNLVSRIRRLLGEPAPARVPNARASALAGALVLVAAAAIALVVWPPARSFAQAPRPAQSATDKMEQTTEPARQNIEELEALLAAEQKGIQDAEQAVEKSRELLQRNAANLDRSIESAGGHSDELAQAEEQLQKAEAALKELETQARESQQLFDRQGLAFLKQLDDAQRSGPPQEYFHQYSRRLQELKRAQQQAAQQLQELTSGKFDEALRREQQQIEQAELALRQAGAFDNQSLERIEKELQQAEKVAKEYQQGVMLGVQRASRFWGLQNESLLAQAQPAKSAQAMAELGSAYQKWLDEDVAYIITAEEKRDFLASKTDADREQFVEKFWLRRDPTPGTAENEFKEEHYRRIAHANEHFASSVPGWRTDRGRIYIMYGPPDQIEVNKMENVLRQVWRYTHIDGLGYDIETEFTDTSKTDDFHMTAAPASHGSYWQVMTVTPEQAQTVVESLRAKGFPALAARLSFWGGGAFRAGAEAASTSKSVMLETRSVLVGPYPDEASLAKAKAALEADSYHPVRAQ